MEQQKTSVIEIIPDKMIARICAWCKDSVEQTQRLSEEGFKTTHALCAFHLREQLNQLTQ